ncbi:hypothetical protein NFI95_14085 [Acetobacteraceae bacterium KSS8]|uniref:YXWGXW repeat-containing protein n=1 Tax=Endosaccharibacter trunci TaxID=2812733 RepID=A0ABT1WBS4_9PROT|nr:hypothetical protein [Acetobacteraceae bacterium KSS8]
MKTTLIGAALCALVSAASIRAADAATIAAHVDPEQTATVGPAGVPVLQRAAWWAGPNTVCYHGYYYVHCRPAYARPWVPGHYSWNGYWIPGHWA